MNTARWFKKFRFDNHADHLYLLTTDILMYASEHAVLSEDVAFKLKIVLIELLTNSLKHSGHSETIIEIGVEIDKISIKKIDEGNAFAVKSHQVDINWPLAVEHLGKTIEIYGDFTCKLKAKLEDSCHAIFFVEDFETMCPDIDIINNLTEHFGLLIICRACYKFEYEFDELHRTNNFTATLLTQGQQI